MQQRGLIGRNLLLPEAERVWEGEIWAICCLTDTGISDITSQAPRHALTRGEGYLSPVPSQFFPPKKKLCFKMNPKTLLPFPLSSPQHPLGLAARTSIFFCFLEQNQMLCLFLIYLFHPFFTRVPVGALAEPTVGGKPGENYFNLVKSWVSGLKPLTFSL